MTRAQRRYLNLMKWLTTRGKSKRRLGDVIRILADKIEEQDARIKRLEKAYQEGWHP